VAGTQMIEAHQYCLRCYSTCSIRAQTISTQAIMRLFAGNPRTELAIGTRPCAGLLCAVVRSTNVAGKETFACSENAK
jgi:hypothetical protein